MFQLLHASKQQTIRVCLAAAALAAGSLAHGAPLSNGTLLTINQGGVGYPEGTCTGSYLRYLTNSLICYPISAGTDGGLVVGKSQKSGGQELGPSGHQSKPGEMVSAFYLPPVYATLATAPMVGATSGSATTDASLNKFDDTSCSGAACLGTVEINTMHLAVDGKVYAGGCAVADCSSTGGSGVKTWAVRADGTYILESTWGTTLLHLEGSIAQGGNTPPVAADVRVSTTQGVPVNWTPVVSDADGDPLTCSTLPTTGLAFYGTLTVAANCSSGTYTPPNPLFTGTQCAQYQVSDGKNVSLPANICIDIMPTNTSSCEMLNPVRQVALDGDGFGARNKTLRLVFQGNLIQATNTAVTVCNGTPLYYSATTTVGTASCKLNGVSAAADGQAAPGDTLVCTNKPKGFDTDTFSIYGQ
jgi:hypothetical protein